jgi:hypothetical protein
VQQLVDAGLTMQANVYYKLLISWTNQKVKDTYVTRNTFDFKHGIQRNPFCYHIVIEQSHHVQ